MRLLASHVYYIWIGEPPMRKKLLTSNGISEALSYMNQPKIVQTYMKIRLCLNLC